MQRTRFGEMPCSIARTLEIAGEPWSPLIVRDVWVGINRFEDLHRSLGISRKVLAERLRWLVAHGVLQTRPYSARPPRREYVLSEKGRGFVEVLMAMTAWGDRWAAGEEGPPVRLRHRECGHHTHGELRCAQCGEPLRADNVEIEPGPGSGGS